MKKHEVGELEIGQSEVGKFCWSWKGVHVVGKDKLKEREIGKKEKLEMKLEKWS